MENVEKSSRRSFRSAWCDEAPPEVRNRYIREFLLGLVAYAVVLTLSIWVIKAYPQARWRFVVALTPMAPMAYLVRAYLWYLRRLDELQRQIHLEGLAIAFAGTALTTFGYGFLQTVGFPEVSWFMVWPVMSVFWGVGHWLAAWRYR